VSNFYPRGQIFQANISERKGSLHSMLLVLKILPHSMIPQRQAAPVTSGAFR
jgi:hypothetical protein